MKKDTKYNLLSVLTFVAVISVAMVILYFFVKNLLILAYDI